VVASGSGVVGASVVVVVVVVSGASVVVTMVVVSGASVVSSVGSVMISGSSVVVAGASVVVTALSSSFSPGAQGCSSQHASLVLKIHEWSSRSMLGGSSTWAQSSPEWLGIHLQTSSWRHAAGNPSQHASSVSWRNVSENGSSAISSG